MTTDTQRIPDTLQYDPEDKELIDRLQACLAHPLANSFTKCLERLSGMATARPGAKVRLWRDFAPLSFLWSWYLPDGSLGLHGGLIYHGSHDGFGSGGAPTFSVSLDRTAGWQLHT